MYELLEFRHLKSFLAVVQEGTFTRAAERLHLAQPSLSAQIKQLEEGIPAQLFNRERSRVMLTPAGIALVPFAEQVVRLREQAFETVCAIHNGAAPPLAIGFSHFIDHALVERAFACYQRLFPGSNVRPTTQCAAQLINLLNEGRINAALVTSPIEARYLVIQPIARERLLFCMRKDDPLASADTILPRQIAGRLQITFDPKQHPDFYSYLDSTLARAGITIEPVHLCTTPTDAQWMVKQGLGYALVHESRILEPELIARHVAGVELIAETAFVYRNTERASHLALLACELKNSVQKLMTMNRKKAPKEAVSQIKFDAQMKLLG